MIVVMVDDNSRLGLKRGDRRNLPDDLARELIAKGLAVRENAEDKDAKDVLDMAKDRDAPK